MSSGSPRPPDLDALGLLIAVAETGSLGRAAARYGVTQPAVSLRVRELERSLGVVLLGRSPPGSTLASPGRAVVDWARPLLDMAETFSRSITALAERHQDRLRVAASLTVADHLVPRWLVALHIALPDVAVSLQAVNSDQVAQLVRACDADFGYVEGPSAPAGLRSRIVGGDKLLVVVAPRHPWTRRRKSISPLELAATPMVLREQGSGTREALERALGAHGLAPVPVLQLGSQAAIKVAVAAGQGPAVLSELTLSSDLANGRLVAVRVDRLDLSRRFRAVWRTGRVPAWPAATLLTLSARATRR